jgi:hypothetical protein
MFIKNNPDLLLFLSSPFLIEVTLLYCSLSAIISRDFKKFL